MGCERKKTPILIENSVKKSPAKLGPDKLLFVYKDVWWIYHPLSSYQLTWMRNNKHGIRNCRVPLYGDIPTVNFHHFFSSTSPTIHQKLQCHVRNWLGGFWVTTGDRSARAARRAWKGERIGKASRDHAGDSRGPKKQDIVTCSERVPFKLKLLGHGVGNPEAYLRQP